MRDKKKETNIKYLAILHIVLAVYSILGIASKIASGKEFLTLEFCFFYGIVILNLFVYAIFWQQIIKKIPLVTAYANKAVTVIWGIIWGFVFFKEEITPGKILGAFIIILGICLVVSDNENVQEDEI